jgi:hypothetical protein
MAEGYASSGQALTALDEVYADLSERCLAEQREAASSSERQTITAAYDRLLTRVAKTMDFLRGIPDATPRATPVYVPNGKAP